MLLHFTYSTVVWTKIITATTSSEYVFTSTSSSYALICWSEQLIKVVLSEQGGSEQWQQEINFSFIPLYPFFTCSTLKHLCECLPHHIHWNVEVWWIWEQHGEFLIGTLTWRDFLSQWGSVLYSIQYLPLSITPFTLPCTTADNYEIPNVCICGFWGSVI